jgi:hypothetical protein
MGPMPITMSRTGTLAGIFAAAYRAVPASHLLSDNRATHPRSSYATAYDAAVTAITEAGLTRDTMPAYAARVLDDLRFTARGQSARMLPVRQQQMQSSLALADAMARLLTED